MNKQTGKNLHKLYECKLRNTISMLKIILQKWPQHWPEC